MSDETDNKQDQPQYMTAKDLNGALTKMQKEMQKVIDSKLQEVFSQLSPSKQETSEAAPVLNKADLSVKLSEQEKQIKILLEERKQREEETKAMKLEKQLRETLNKHGIKSKDGLAIDHLRNKISYSDDGTLLMQNQIGIPVSLEDAVSEFAQTDNGKFLQDAKDIRGSGASTASRGFTPPQSQIPGMKIREDGTAIYTDLQAVRRMAAAKLDSGALKR
jgi:hypothetical protein